MNGQNIHWGRRGLGVDFPDFSSQLHFPEGEEELLSLFRLDQKCHGRCA